MELAEQLALGVEALRKGAWDQAERALGPVAADADLAAADTLRDIRARVLSLHAQALLELGRLEEADRRCRDAIRLLRALGDKDGLNEVRALQDRVVAALAHDSERAARAAERDRVVATPLAELMAGAATPVEQIGVLVKKATAHADAGDLAAGAPLAREALDRAHALGETTWAVLAGIALARLLPDEAQVLLVEAHATAEAANEFNLVSTVARAATVAGVALPVHMGPHAPRTPEVT